MSDQDTTTNAPDEPTAFVAAVADALAEEFKGNAAAIAAVIAQADQAGDGRYYVPNPEWGQYEAALRALFQGDRVLDGKTYVMSDDGTIRLVDAVPAAATDDPAADAADPEHSTDTADGAAHEATAGPTGVTEV